MNPNTITPHTAALLENGCYLLSEDEWQEIIHVASALDSLIELTGASEKSNIQLSIGSLQGLLSTLSFALGAVENSLIWQPPCSIPKNAA